MTKLPDNNWFVITGGPSTGKTTLLKHLQQKGHHIIHEAARAVIEDGLAAGLTLQQIRADEKHFQEQVLRRKVATERQHDKQKLTFFDRGMHDTVAYMRYYAFEIGQEIEDAIKEAFYRLVFVLEPLPFFEADHARTEDQDFTHKLNDLLHKAYTEDGLPTIGVPVMQVEDRAEFVLGHVSQATVNV